MILMCLSFALSMTLTICFFNSCLPWPNQSQSTDNHVSCDSKKHGNVPVRGGLHTLEMLLVAGDFVLVTVIGLHWGGPAT